MELDPKKRLPHPSGPLSTIISASSITAANEEVKSIITTGKERGSSLMRQNLPSQGMQLKMGL